MKKYFTKIVFIIGLGTFISSCDAVKKVPANQHLLEKNTILVDEVPVKEEGAVAQLYQEPNKSLLRFKLRLHLYNLATENTDSLYQAWLDRRPNRYRNLSALLSEKQVERLGQSFLVSGYSQFLKNVGEAPVIVKEEQTKKSADRLKNYYFNQGYFNTKVSYQTDTLEGNKATVTYKVEREKPYFVDSITTRIATPALDSLYHITKDNSIIQKGKQYNKIDFDAERDRITSYFRNRGAYHFQQNYINYKIDTVGTDHKANIEIIIGNQQVRDGEEIYSKPFNLYKISEINIFTNNQYDKEEGQKIDSTSYQGFNIYSLGKLRYRPKALTDAVFIRKGERYSDVRDMLTRRSLNNLNIFNYPTIQYVEDKSDPTGNSLIANITLSSVSKFHFASTIDVTHSNIQDFGIEGNVSYSIRNVFKGAEILQLGLRGNVGSSQDLANPNDVFFNISEYGADLKLIVPRILFPLKTERIISKTMIPATDASLGFFKQENIGLDKENFTGIINYKWNPARRVNMRLDLANIQYIRNINASNYFNVYRSSYNRLNNLAQQYGANPDYLDPESGNLTAVDGTAGFIDDVLNGQTAIIPNSMDYKTVHSIEERRKRLTENNLILASNITFFRSTRTGLYDNSFHSIRMKVESAGGLLSLLSSIGNREKNDNGRYDVLNVDYSQYIKTEAEFIKHWDLGDNQVFATRVFGGIAIPYGNSDNIPFSRSYFAGGSNDNRGWQAYTLGPGRSGGINDFNEANMKIAASAEYRFRLLGKLGGAFFVDAGNIWNVFDNIEDEDYIFKDFNSLKNIAVGSGIGFRYNLGFVIVRLDLGFKTYNPAREEDNRWFKGYRLKESVLNIGINYPF